MSNRLCPVKRLAAWLTLGGSCLFLGFGSSGCHKTEKLPTVNVKIFDSAPQEIKDAWSSALSAAETNGYAAAYLTLGQMRAQPGLSEEQRQVIANESTLVHTKMTEAAQKGDPAALQAIQEIREASRHR